MIVVMPPSTLTDRQLEVLKARVLHGTKGAARALGISPFTVRNHLAQVRLRLGVETTEQAVYILVLRGSLTIPGLVA